MKRGRILLFIVAVVSALPASLTTALTWFTWIDFDGTRTWLTILGFIQLAGLAIAFWLLINMLQKKLWARMGWLILCCVWFLGFSWIGFLSFAIGGWTIIPIILALLVFYAGLNGLLYMNKGINSFLKGDKQQIENMIQDIGQ